MTKRQLQRMWREFPWLWSVRDDWCTPRDSVQVRFADEVQIWNLPYRGSQNIRVFVHLANEDTALGDRERVVKLGVPQHPTTLGGAIFNLTFGEILHIAVDIGSLYIFRKPKDSDFRCLASGRPAEVRPWDNEVKLLRQALRGDKEK